MQDSSIYRWVVRTGFVLAILYLFLVFLKLFTGALGLFGEETVKLLLGSIQDPIVALFVGILATSIIQSSSTTTSITVALVGSGVVDIQLAVPIILGANIGTSVTSTILAYAHVGKKSEFKRAVTAATMHDFFNIMMVALVFPIEYLFQGLSRFSQVIASLLAQEDHVFLASFSYLTKPITDWVLMSFASLPWLLLILALVGLYTCIRLFANGLKQYVVGKTESKLKRVLFKSRFRSWAWGVFLTGLVQSSSITTSLLVPIVAAKKVSFKKAFPFLLGANVGTTFTALIASIASTEAALTVALAHLFFNLFGSIIFLPVPNLQRVPIRLAKSMGRTSSRSTYVGIVYLIGTFFVVPFLVFYLFR